MPEPTDWRKDKWKHLWEEIRCACSHYLLACDALEDALMDVKAAQDRCREIYEQDLQFGMASETVPTLKAQWKDLIGYMDEVGNLSKALAHNRSSGDVLAILKLKNEFAKAKREAILQAGRRAKKGV
jgi:hypothetical protein